MKFRRFQRKYKYSRRKNFAYLVLILLACSIGLGYAAIKTDLSIIGTSKFINASWDVHFENIQVKEGSITPSTVATITDDTTVTFSAQLEEPGEFYEFIVDVVNEGTMNAMIESFQVLPVLTQEQQEYFDYIVEYADGTAIANNHKLDAGESETIRVAFIYKTLQDTSLYPTEDQDLTISVTIDYVQKGDTAIDVPHPPTLYGVLEDAANVGTYAMKYTGEHQDSYAGTGTKDIYHWYATNDNDGTAILDKNNVIFAGQCWQMLRTTDTGGVKMIYNGESENNQCLNTRGNHIGYAERTSQNLASNYYYGTSYEYDSNNNVFSLSGTLTQETWNASTGPTLVGKYTCKQTTESGTCATLYLVESYYNTSSGYVIPLNSNSHYSQFGKLKFNNLFKYNSPAYVGYMYNAVYPVIMKYESYNFSYSSLNTNYYYSDAIDWNTIVANHYTLINPIPISSLSGDYSSLVGKYIPYSNAVSDTRVHYVIAVKSNNIYFQELSNGDLNTSLTIGDSYTESGGVYTLTGNVTNVPYTTWYSSSDFSVYKGKYVCDGNNTSCTNIKHISSYSNPYESSFFYFDPTSTWSYAEDFSYSNGTYTLTGDIKTFWDLFETTNQSYLTTHRYTCLGEGTSCAKVGYIINLSSTLYYVELSGGVNGEMAINEMLNSPNVNVTNSIIKTGIEAWYEKFINNYDNYIEDTIYCNDRTITSYGNWSSNIQNITTNNYLQFKNYILNNDLSCGNITDKFSTLNSSARLKYKVGLATSSELRLFRNIMIYHTGESYWLISPSYFSNTYSTYMRYIFSSSVTYNLLDVTEFTDLGVRPVVSLSPGTVYRSGDGSMASPYLVE